MKTINNLLWRLFRKSLWVSWAHPVAGWAKATEMNCATWSDLWWRRYQPVRIRIR